MNLKESVARKLGYTFVVGGFVGMLAGLYGNNKLESEDSIYSKVSSVCSKLEKEIENTKLEEIKEECNNPKDENKKAELMGDYIFNKHQYIGVVSMSVIYILMGGCLSLSSIKEKTLKEEKK